MADDEADGGCPCGNDDCNCDEECCSCGFEDCNCADEEEEDYEEAPAEDAAATAASVAAASAASSAQNMAEVRQLMRSLHSRVKVMEDRVVAGRVFVEQRMRRLEDAVEKLTRKVSASVDGEALAPAGKRRATRGAAPESALAIFSGGSAGAGAGAGAGSGYRDGAVGAKRGRAGAASSGAAAAAFPAGGSTIEVHVQSSTRGVFSLAVLPSKTVAALKGMICDIEGTPVELQRLRLGGHELANRKSLEACGVVDGTAVDLLFRKARGAAAGGAAAGSAGAGSAGAGVAAQLALFAAPSHKPKRVVVAVRGRSSGAAAGRSARGRAQSSQRRRRGGGGGGKR